MPIWDEISQDPLKMMILMKGMQDLPRSLSKQYLPPSNMPGYAQGGGGYGGGGSDGGLDMGSILRMQQLQAAQANQQADNELQRQQFEMNQQKAAAEQQQAQERAAMVDQAVPGIVDRTGLSADVVRAALLGGIDPSNPLLKAVGALAEPYTMSGGQVRFGPGNVPVAQVADKTELGSFLPLSGQQIDPSVVNARGAIARAGRTSIVNQLDARNMGNAEEGMQNALIEERKALVGDIDGLRGEMAVVTQAADHALAHPDWFGPLAEQKATLLRAKAAAMAPFGGKLAPDETEFLSFVDTMKEGKAEQTLRKVEKLTPVTEVEYQKQEDTVIGANSTIPRAVVKSIRAKKQYDYAMEKKRFIDQATHQMIQEARAGGQPYSPGRLQMLVEDWEKQNPFPMESYVKELSALSQAYPVGGGKSGGAAPPPQSAPQGGGGDDPLGLLGP